MKKVGVAADAIVIIAIGMLWLLFSSRRFSADHFEKKRGVRLLTSQLMSIVSFATISEISKSAGM